MDLQTTTGAVKILNDAAARFEKANPGFKAEQSHIQNGTRTRPVEDRLRRQPAAVRVQQLGRRSLCAGVRQGRTGRRSDALSRKVAFKGDRFAPAGSARSLRQRQICGIPAEKSPPAMAVVFFNKIFAKGRPDATQDLGRADERGEGLQQKHRAVRAANKKVDRV